MTLAVVQTATNWQIRPSPGPSVTFGSAPTNGNLMIIISLNFEDSTAQNGWTKLAGSTPASNNTPWLWYKYAGASEPTTQQYSNDGFRDIVSMAWEISGVSGTWATDFQQYVINEDVFMTTALNTETWPTATADAMILTLGAGKWGAGETVTGFQPSTNTTDDAGNDTMSVVGVGGQYPFTGSHQFVSSGTTPVTNYTFGAPPDQSFGEFAALFLNGTGGSTPVTSDPGAGSLTITGYAPAPIIPSQAFPGAGSLALTGFAPTARPVAPPARPGLGTLSLTGFTPIIEGSPHPGFGTLTLTGYAPTAQAPAVLRMTNMGLLSLGIGASDTRITYAGFLVHGLVTTQTRITNLGLHALAETANNTRVTNLGLLVLAKGAPAPITPNPLNLPGSFRSKIVNQRLINMYYEPTPDGPSGDARFSRGGLVSAAVRGGGPVYAVFGWNGYVFTVSGNNVFRDDTNIGVIQAGDNVRWATSETQIILVTGGQAYSVSVSEVTPLADLIPGFTISDVIFTASGQFVYTTVGSGRWYWSAVGDGTSVDPLSFATAEAYPYNLVGAINLDDTFILLTTGHAEFWYGTGATDTPYQREQGRIYTKGLLAQETLKQADNTAFFLGSDRIVYRAAAEPQRVSTHDVENYIRKVSDEGIGSAWAFTTFIGGHTFYVLSLPEGQGTWAFDISQNRWAEWKSFGQENFRVRSSFNNVLGDQYGGNIMFLDAETYNDMGQPLERLVGTYLPLKSGALKNYNLMMSTIRGVGNVNIPDPHVEMRFSDSEGRFWSNWLTAPLGPQGIVDDSAKAIWYDLGALKAPGRLYEFRTTDDVEFTPYAVKFNEARP